jgi:hypothetical protein
VSLVFAQVEKVTPRLHLQSCRNLDKLPLKMLMAAGYLFEDDFFLVRLQLFGEIRSQKMD